MLTREDIENEDVVALYIEGNIYLGSTAIEKAKEHGKVDGIIFRRVFKFMAELDLDPKWTEYAQYPTLFIVKEYNEWGRLPKGKPIC